LPTRNSIHECASAQIADFGPILWTSEKCHKETSWSSARIDYSSIVTHEGMAFPNPENSTGGYRCRAY